MNQLKHRVFLQDVAALTPYGSNVEDFRTSYLSSQSAVKSYLEYGYSPEFPIKQMAYLENFNRSYGNNGDRLAASLSELSGSSRIKNCEVDEVIVGKGSSTFTLDQWALAAQEPLPVSQTHPIFSDKEKIIHFLKTCNINNRSGRMTFVSNTCATSLYAIGMAFNKIKSGLRKKILVLNYDVMGFRNQILSLYSIRALSTRKCSPIDASCPFSLERDGLVKAEGIFAFLVGTKDSSTEILGWHGNNDSYSLTGFNPNLLSIREVMALAVSKSGLQLTQIDHINLHGSSTKENDHFEKLAIDSLFGKLTDKILFTASKSLVGHATYASGAYGVLSSHLMLERREVWQTKILTPDPQAQLNFLVNSEGFPKLRTSIINAFGFGGHNASMVLARSD